MENFEHKIEVKVDNTTKQKQQDAYNYFINLMASLIKKYSSQLIKK